MDDKEIICNFESLYKAYRKAKAGKGNCYKLCQSMDMLVKELLESEE